MNKWSYPIHMNLVVRQAADEELGDLIKKGLYVNEHQSNELFKSKRKAEYLERILFVCPSCLSLETITSNKNKINCIFINISS